MSYYPDRINEYFLHPRNVGEADEAAAVGDMGSLICGAVLRLTISVDRFSHKISDARFRATGCGYLIASASILTESLKGITIEEASSVPIFLETVFTERLGKFPADRRHCAVLCRDALGAAITGYRTSTETEWAGDEALICTCFGVSEKEIENVIQSAALQTVAQVSTACDAGAGCGSCRPLIEDILEDYWRTEHAGTKDLSG